VFALGDVARDFRRTDDPPRGIFERGDGQRYFHWRTIFADAHRLEMVHALAAQEVGEDFGLFLLAVRRNEHGNGLTDGFLRRVAEETLGAFVPTGDDVVEVFADDGVVGISNN